MATIMYSPRSRSSIIYALTPCFPLGQEKCQIVEHNLSPRRDAFPEPTARTLPRVRRIREIFSSVPPLLFYQTVSLHLSLSLWGTGFLAFLLQLPLSFLYHSDLFFSSPA